MTIKKPKIIKIDMEHNPSNITHKSRRNLIAIPPQTPPTTTPPSKTSKKPTTTPPSKTSKKPTTTTPPSKTSKKPTTKTPSSKTPSSKTSKKSHTTPSSKTSTKPSTTTSPSKTSTKNTDSPKKYENLPKNIFCGPAGGTAPGKFPVDSESRCSNALSRAHFAPNPQGVRDCALKKAKDHGWTNCGKNSKYTKKTNDK